MRGAALAKYVTIKDKAVGLIPGMRWALTAAAPTAGDTLRYDGSEWVVGPRLLTGTTTYNPPNLASNAGDTGGTVTVTGAAAGDSCRCSHASVAQAIEQDCAVTAADTCTCILTNRTGGAVDLASGTLRCTVEKWP